MPYLNNVTLMGHLTADPELLFTPAGEKLANFTVAVNYKDKKGQSHGEFFDCQVWRGWAENLCKNAKKGDLVLVDGRISQERWKDKETGKERSRVRVMAQRVFTMQVKYEEPTEGENSGGDDAPY